MTIRQKLLLTILTTSVFVTILLYTLAHSILLHGFTELESNMQFSNTQRVLNTLQQEINTLSGTVADWAYWDDTYEFVGGNNPSYLEDNLTAETFANLELNMVLLVDSDDHIVYSQFYDFDTGFVPSPLHLDSVSIASLIPDGVELEDSVTGIVEVEGILLLVAARNVLDSHLNAPIRGHLIFGRYLDQSKIASLSRTTETNLSLLNINNPEIRDLVPTLQQSRGGQSVLVHQLSPEEVASYSLLKDISGNAIYVLQARAPREIYKYGLESVTYFVSSLFLIGVIFLIAMLILIERMIVARITSLNQSVTAIRAARDFTVSIDVTGNDEIAIFATTFRQLLEEIAFSHEALEKTNAELEDKVAQRTLALAQTNAELKKEVFERKQAQAKLQESMDRALDASRLKSQILANVSHDARTPLSVIILYAQMFQAGMYGSLTEKQATIVQTILSNAQKMLVFVNNLLQESRAGEPEKEKLHIVRFPTVELLEDIETMFRPLAVEKKLQLTSSVSMKVPTELYGDSEKVRQIINNLVDNAIKFTHEGRIHVSLYPQDSEHLMIEVADTGIGIAPEHKDKIFDSFWQVDGTITRRVNRGVGLGLSIVQKLATLMDGNVTVEANSPNPGTTFKVALPYGNPV